MGGSSPPPDNSAEVARIEAEQARLAREEERRLAKEARQRFENSLSSAYSTGIDSARNYNVIAAKKADASNYIVKPFNAATLQSKIEAVFNS